MEENNKKENFNKEYIIGILLMMPFSIITFIILSIFNFDFDFIKTMSFFSMYVPISIGIYNVLSLYKKEKRSQFFKNDYSFAGMIVFIILSIYNFFNIYFYDKMDTDTSTTNYIFYGLISTIIYRALAFYFYSKLVGWKRALLLLSLIYTIIFLIIILKVII